jgi:hypothetical protein
MEVLAKHDHFLAAREVDERRVVEAAAGRGVAEGDEFDAQWRDV